ncbi:MAG: hypothetical protein SF172_09350, partial [Burkholderiales bacterium]|nr:hypothetical protein [Burkholderiales bacterium]
PNGATFQSSFGISNGLVNRLPVISVAGTYTIRITPASNGTGSVQLTAWKDLAVPLDAAATSPTSVSIAFGGQQVRHTFAGTAGDALNYALSAVTLSSGGTVQVLSPVGSTIVSPSGFGAGGLLLNIPTLTTTGTYTIVVIPSSQGTGSFDARLTAR